MFTTSNKGTRCKRLVCHVALEYGLKDLPCSIEWIDVRYRFNIRVWSHYINMRAFINMHKMLFKNTAYDYKI